MWLILAAFLAFYPGEVMQEDAVYCDNVEATDNFLHVLGYTHDVKVGFSAVNNDEHPQVCGIVKDRSSIYIRHVKTVIYGEYLYDIHEVWMQELDVMQYVFTSVKLESS